MGIIGIGIEYSHFLDKPRLDVIPAAVDRRSDKELLRSKSKLGLLFLSFSFTRNFSKLMSTEGGRGLDSNLDVFAGVRTLSMMYVVFGHTNLVMGVNYPNIQATFGSMYGVLIQGGLYAVDAFFCMAGFLANYVLLGKLAKSKGKINILLAYFHRWYRLVPALAFLILTGMYLFPFIIQGPISWQYKQAMINNCERYWWSSLPQ